MAGDYRTRMEIFDRMPPRLRRAIDECVIGCDEVALRDFLELAKAYGEGVAVAAVPDWVRRNQEYEAIREASAQDPLAKALAQALLDRLGDSQAPPKPPQPAADFELMRGSVQWGRRRKKRLQR